MWGHHPWENDYAADWLTSTVIKTKLRKQVIAILLDEQSIQNNYKKACKARAAVYILTNLGMVYCWPIDFLKGDLKAGITALSKIKSNIEYCTNPLMETELNKEAEILRNRLDLLP